MMAKSALLGGLNISRIMISGLIVYQLAVIFCTGMHCKLSNVMDYGNNMNG
jgi:hypothetical protein